MLNYGNVISAAFGSVWSKKGFGSFKRFQGFLKRAINNIDYPQIEKKVSTVWQMLRKKRGK